MVQEKTEVQNKKGDLKEAEDEEVDVKEAEKVQYLFYIQLETLVTCELLY